MADESNRETIEVVYLVKVEDALAKSEELRKSINANKDLLKRMATETGESLRVLAKGMTDAFDARKIENIAKLKDDLAKIDKDLNPTQQATEMARINAQIQEQIKSYARYKGIVSEATNEVKKLNIEQKNTVTTGAGVKGFLQSLGSVGQFVFGSILGVTAVTALRNIVRYFQEATKAGFEYAQALQKLRISTNILQEKGYNITLRETLNLVTRLNQEFPIFTRKQVVEGVGYIQLLSQNLALTSDQMKNLAEVAGGLAVVLGKDVNEAAKELALFLSSGYGEALQRAGILASKSAVMHELLAMGIKTGYNETSAAIRAQAGYNVIMRDAIKLVEKAREVQEEDAYAATKAGAAWQGLKDIIGIRLVPTLAALYRESIKVADGIKGIIGLLGLVSSEILLRVAQITASIRILYDVLSEKPTKLGLQEAMKDLTKVWVTGVEQIRRTTRELHLPDIFTDMTDSAIGAGTAMEEEAEIIANAVADLYTAITDAQKDFISDSKDLWTDNLRDLDQLETDAARRRAESWIDYYADAYEIARKMNDDMIWEEIKFQLDLEQINREDASKKEDANQKYRDKEYKAQKDFEEKMRRLREEFLFDLEDALRERDARQVLRLIRRFNLDQARLERERTSEREDRQREYRRELEDIDKQKAERLQKLKEEHQARMLEIKRQEVIELRELEIKHAAELVEIDRRLQQEQDDRKLRYDQQQADLKERFEERIREIGTELQAEYNLTKEQLDKIGNEYTKLYGQNGVVQRAIDYALIYLSAAYAQFAVGF